MTALHEAVAAHLAASGWAVFPVAAGETFAIPVRAESGQWLCYVHVLGAAAQIVCHSVCPLTVPAAQRLAMAEFLTRANFGLVIGNFELDFDDGEVRYKTSLDLIGTDLTAPLVRSLLAANVAAMDRYLPGILAVIGTDSAPDVAVSAIESAS